MSSERPRLEPPTPPPVAGSPEQVAEVFKRYEGWWLTEQLFELLRGQARRHCRNVARWSYSWSRLPLKTAITVYRCGDVDVKVTVIKPVGVEAPRYVYIERVEVKVRRQ